MAKVITAHLVVEFSGEDGNVSAFVEVDDREFGFNAGKTTFLPGQNAYLLLFKPTGYSVVYFASTAGVLQRHLSQHQKAVEEFLTFPNQDQNMVRYPISSDFSYAWVGNSPGVSLQKTGEFSLALPARPIDPDTQLPIPQYRIAIARATYNANCEVWKLRNVPAAVQQVLCFFVIKKDSP